MVAERTDFCWWLANQKAEIVILLFFACGKTYERCGKGIAKVDD